MSANWPCMVQLERIWFGVARSGSVVQTCIYDDLTYLRTRFEEKSSCIPVNTVFIPFSIEKEYNPVLIFPHLMQLCAVELYTKGKNFEIHFLNAHHFFPWGTENSMRGRWRKNTTGQWHKWLGGVMLSLYFSLSAMCIQGDSGGICNTSGNDSMCDSKQKSSYEHGSNFEQLPRYGKKKIWTILRAWMAIT